MLNHFCSIEDCPDPKGWIYEALKLKDTPYEDQLLGANKTLGLIFFNASLRTRLSTIKAAQNLGMEAITFNVNKEGWQLETAQGVVMDGDHAEHITEAAAVMGGYCDILGVRAFPSLLDKREDYSEKYLLGFQQYAGVSIINLESATLHPLQSFADLMTIEQHKKKKRPKVVMTWAPHVKALPQAVPNSFSQWMQHYDADFHIAHPKGMELDVKFTKNATLSYDQDEAFEAADFVYVKNWSSYHDYGRPLNNQPDWMVTLEKLERTHQAKLMHCLPVRRNVVIADNAMNSKHSIIQDQAYNRIFATQLVLKKLLTRS
jgi:N-succinyl-L-ornithine transcarbamylase|tara:strand:+ start:419 stop:1369 length:951 start_codon:yes stop_codon:yes gene_type:complete